MPYKQRVGGSNPSTPTAFKPVPQKRDRFYFYALKEACLLKENKNKTAQRSEAELTRQLQKTHIVLLLLK